MIQELYLCIHAAEFHAQSLLRLRHELKNNPIVILDGHPPEEVICSMNRSAGKCGAKLGMTRLDAEAIEGLKILGRSKQMEQSARNAFLERLVSFSPRIEEVSRGTSCGFVLDISGSERLFGPPAKIAESLRTVFADIGFRVSIAVSFNFDTARLKAAARRGISLIPPGMEAVSLGNLPITALELEDEYIETYTLWGIRTLGEIADLPEADLVTRFGRKAQEWIHLARGNHPHIFQPIEPELDLQEYCEFETPVEQIESLFFVAARMMDCLAERASRRALCLASLRIQLALETGNPHCISIKPAIPTIDRKLLLKLMHLELTAHPPQSSVVALRFVADTSQSSKIQLGLFTPQVPEPSRLDDTLARIRSIVGDDQVGSPVLDDSHRSEHFHIDGFDIRHEAKASDERLRTGLALRRIRPPVPVRVVLSAEKPTYFSDSQSRFDISDAFGPWRSSGCWWSSSPWDTEEWDVFAHKNDESPITCLLVHNLMFNHWQLEAIYD